MLNGEHYTFTGKERDKHSVFDYYYFGARYYDYRIGQFSSIDKASQFASGYLYGGNNPICYIDKDGNFVWLIPAIAGLVGGVGNIASHWSQIDNVWQGLGFFGVGVAQGVVSCVSPAAALAAGIVAGGLNEAIGGGDWGDILHGCGVGGVSSLAGLAGSSVTRSVVDNFGLGNKLAPGFVGLVGGARGGAGGGFAAGAAGGLLSGQNLDEALKAGLKGTYAGAAYGAATGFATAAIAAHSQGRDPFNGEYDKTGIGPVNKGKAGVNYVSKELAVKGNEVLGKEITFDADKFRLRADIVMKENGEIVLVEVKNGNYAQLRINQRHAFEFINNGEAAIPRGQNASNANLVVGKPIVVKMYIYYVNVY